MKLKKAIVVYKGCRSSTGTPLLVTLRIAKGTTVRVDPARQGNNKNRATSAEVLCIEDANGAQHDHAYSTWTGGPRTKYVVGAKVKPSGWTKDLSNDCGQGIHFWKTREMGFKWVKVALPTQATINHYQSLASSADRDSWQGRALRAENALRKVKAALA